MRVVAISGSLQLGSANSQLLRAVVAAAPPEVEVVVWDELGDVPPFRPDVADDDAPDSVTSLRRAIGGSDVVLIATPEYAGGMPGSLKNALDWVVGSGELYAREVVVVSAAPAPERGAQARRWTEETLAMQGARVSHSFTEALRSTDSPEIFHAAADRVLAAVYPSVPQ